MRVRAPTQAAIVPVRLVVHVPKVVVAKKFRIDENRLAVGMIDIFFECSEKWLPIQKLTFDLTLLGSNLATFKQYAAELQTEENDAALSHEIPPAAEGVFANMLSLTHFNSRAEMSFGFVTLNEWMTKGKEANRSNSEVKVDVVDIMVVLADAPFQKKLVMELLRLVSSRKA